MFLLKKEHIIHKEVQRCLKFEQTLLQCYSKIETFILKLDPNLITSELESFTNEVMSSIDKKIELSDTEILNQNEITKDTYEYCNADQKYNENIKIKPKYEEACRNKIFALVMTCQLEEALEECINGLKRFPESIELKNMQHIIKDSF